uniref:Uncharacterized protein n=1 Tax=Picea sitchensis TaxID=3332 RepID=B8LKP8_PICSI|nr:unknown [Picea sitchensis]
MAVPSDSMTAFFFQAKTPFSSILSSSKISSFFPFEFPFFCMSKKMSRVLNQLLFVGDKFLIM